MKWRGDDIFMVGVRPDVLRGEPVRPVGPPDERVMVGATGVEPATSASQTRRATTALRPGHNPPSNNATPKGPLWG